MRVMVVSIVVGIMVISWGIATALPQDNNWLDLPYEPASAIHSSQIDAIIAQLPQPPATQAVDQKLAQQFPGMTVYETASSFQQVKDFYQTQMVARGWTMLTELSKTFSVGLAGSDDAQNTVLSFLQDKAVVIVMFPFGQAEAGKKQQYTVIVKQLPPQAADTWAKVYGAQLPQKIGFMPLYPDLRQIYSSQTEKGLTLEYVSDQSVEKIRDFYQEKMPENGWKLITDESLTLNLSSPKQVHSDLLLGSMSLSSSAPAWNLKFTSNKNETCTMLILSLESSELPLSVAKTMMTVMYKPGE